MEKENLQKLLFKVAFCTMSCDGDIDDREIEEMKLIDTQTSYFANIDLSNELAVLVKNFEAHGVGVIEELFGELKQAELNPIQELLLLEVAIRIIYADKRVDENEVKFFNFLRSYLKVPNEIIHERFGKIDFLESSDYYGNLHRKEEGFIKTMELPEMIELRQIDFSKKQ